LLRGHDEICQRYVDIEEAVDVHPSVIEYLTTLDEQEEEFYEHLRNVADMPEASSEDIYDLCGYIDWA